MGIIGKLCRQKGQGDFLRAAKIIADVFPESQFVICGSGDDTELRSLARGLPVEFLGWRDDIAAVLSELDLLVIASRQEGLPRVMLEAFSAGVPVIAYPAGGMCEAIEDGKTGILAPGFLAPEFSPEALASRIGSVSGELSGVALAARQCWEQRYTVTTYQTRILDVMQAAGLERRVRSAITPLPQHTR
jgi:glycosyltransferase involved in cell wall biosynthesis